jgi:hypothetical protein
MGHLRDSFRGPKDGSRSEPLHCRGSLRDPIGPQTEPRPELSRLAPRSDWSASEFGEKPPFGQLSRAKYDLVTKR